nr:UDP-N-acetylglucosamine--N-acetylmuramyl-(pentapeptide) pyrophosphoryl-undecaprenol N-acetylglucosamine transferase [Terrimesophilobacter mesophilus]
MAGGGTAGHVNPLLAVADRLRRDDPDAAVLVLGTPGGIEARLVPARGYELATIEKVPLPRHIGRELFRFPARFLRTVRETRDLIAGRDIDVVVGFGGFVSAPAYIAAWREKVALVVHEANRVPGFANRLGSWLTRFVGVAFAGTRLRHARVVGMPLSSAIETLDPLRARLEALEFFGFASDSRVLLVTGGSLGARSLNETVSSSIAGILSTGWSVLHITGTGSNLTDGGLPGYHVVRYCDRMDLALSTADLAVTRAGAATVSELAALGIPAVYVPLPIGNGEQRRNVSAIVAAGGSLLVANADFTPEWVGDVLVPLLRDTAAVAELAAKVAPLGVKNGTERTVELIHDALQRSTGSA